MRKQVFGGSAREIKRGAGSRGKRARARLVECWKLDSVTARGAPLKRGKLQIAPSAKLKISRRSLRRAGESRKRMRGHFARVFAELALFQRDFLLGRLFALSRSNSVGLNGIA